MKKGELWVAEIHSLGGHEQHGTRPVIIVADTAALLAVSVPITSNALALRFPYTLEINPSERNGLKDFSVALIFQIRAIDKQRLKQKIGILDPQTIKNVDGMLKKLLAL